MGHRKDALYKVEIKTPKGVRVKLEDVNYEPAFAVCESLRDGSEDPKLTQMLVKCIANFGFTSISSGEYRVNISAYLPVTGTGEAHTCGGHQAAAGSQDNLDTWRLIGKDKVCSYCGSLHPERVLELVKEHGLGVLEPSTKSYKWYVTRRDVPNALFGGIKYYRWHDTPAFLAAIKSLSALEGKGE